VKHVSYWFGAVVWIAGVVLSHGFWGTVAAVCVPFYAWYLVMERLMRLAGLL